MQFNVIYSLKLENGHNDNFVVTGDVDVVMTVTSDPGSGDKVDIMANLDIQR